MIRSIHWLMIAGFMGVAVATLTLGSWANQKTESDSNFASQTIDVGMVVSDLDKSLKFYK